MILFTCIPPYFVIFPKFYKPLSLIDIIQDFFTKLNNKQKVSRINTHSPRNRYTYFTNAKQLMNCLELDRKQKHIYWNSNERQNCRNASSLRCKFFVAIISNAKHGHISSHRQTRQNYANTKNHRIFYKEV